MNHAARVLLVDGPPETRDVLEAVFEPRGVAVDRVRSGTARPRPAESPRVLVLHEETAPETEWADVPRIVIGRAELGGGSRGLPQPFEYGELVRAIESVLEERATPA